MFQSYHAWYKRGNNCFLVVFRSALHPRVSGEGPAPRGGPKLPSAVVEDGCRPSPSRNAILEDQIKVLSKRMRNPRSEFRAARDHSGAAGCEPDVAEPRPKRTLRARGGRGTAGQALVEFALVVPMALLLFVGILEMSHYYFARMTLRHSVLEATRFAITGSQVEDPESGDTLSRGESIVHILQAASPTMAIDMESLVIEPPNGGGPGEIVRISATYQYGFSLPLIGKFFPEGLDFTVSTAMKNEPYFP